VSIKQSIPQAGVLDLKSYYRANHYFAEMIKLLPQKTNPNFLTRLFASNIEIGRIHPLETTSGSP